MAARRSTILQASVVAAVIALLVSGAIVAQGFDVAQTPLNDSGVWALQQGDGNRYARVNTELHELDTVKDVANPTGLVQSASTALLFMERNGRLVDIDAARPTDFDDESVEAVDTPTATDVVVASETYLAYLSDSGRITAARIDDGADATTVAIDPYADDNAQPGASAKSFVATVIAIGVDDVLYAYSSAEARVFRFDLARGTQLGFDEVAGELHDGGAHLTVVGSTWVLLGADGASLWIAGREAVNTGLADDAVLQQPSPPADSVRVANRGGMSEFSMTGDSAARVLERGGLIGIPAAPATLDGVIYGAWLDDNTDSGLLWSSAGGEIELSFGAKSLTAEPVPRLRSNERHMILNDIESGWVWTVPDGVLVESSQDWGIAAAANNDSAEDEDQATVVSESKPPVAESDTFGVRAGQLVSLPVLLNDHDPNEDVLTIEPVSVAGLSPGFGIVSLTNNAQDLVVQMNPAASGTATFQYAATDGTQVNGLVSAPTTVTLTVIDPSTNTAPVWCGVEKCTREWPRIQVQPGGSASAEVLRGWVDPEGDPIYVASAEVVGSIGSVASTPDGRVLFQHPDSALSGARTEITVQVADTRGARTVKPLAVEITATPSLTLEPFAVLATAGESLSVDPSAYITGIAGSYAIESASTGLDDTSKITIDGSAATLRFAAVSPGSYLVSYTAHDDLTQAIGTVRVVVVGGDSAQLSTSPITIFVRAKADATVDVFTAVSNPADKILLLSDAIAEPADGASLDLDVVNQHLLRVKGTTSTGQSGAVGVVRYTVSDGTGNSLATARGEATVILLPVLTPRSPIAMPDTVTVRSGAQVDIPVLVNDLAPDGNTLLLNANELRYASDEGLAFVSGSVVRLLAPEAPGEYELGYTVYPAGSPQTSSQGLVRITVLAVGDNRAPEPRTLIGRVLAGASVVVPFDAFGVDPDGDSVALDRILGQPTHGSAAIAATGDAIVYTSVPGFSGPVEFDYRVRDEFGEMGSAIVRIGVLDQASDPSPITYSDYVEVQLGANNRVTIRPAANDLDPAGKTLTVTDVVPDAPAATQEYDDLAALIRLDDEGVTTLTAGTVLGTYTYYYTVSNSTGDTNTGLIVMKVVRESIPDRPQVRDTYLTVEQRALFASGVDVVSGKVSWHSGDIESLKLSLWGEHPGYSVSGWRIAGPLPDSSQLVPFKLTGVNVAGEEVSTFGFLRVPGNDELVLAMRSDIAAQVVNENSSVTFDLAELAAVPPGESLVLDADQVETAGARPEARCEVTSGTTVRYEAGEGEPWLDYCAVGARLSGQSEYTMLLVPITVISEIPLPTLRPAALTHSPAADPITYDLRTMVDWAGKEDDESLEFAVTYTQDQFVVTQLGSVVTIRAIDTASPGRQNTVKVGLSSHPAVASAALSLTVGPAPNLLPKGGTVVSEGCTQANNATSCLIDVIGVPGEVNPVPGTPLVLVSVGPTPSCTGVTMEVADVSRVRASWDADAPGGKCTVAFVVQDAQGRLSPDDRSGSVLLDLAGFPKAPSSLIQTGYGDGLVRLSVSPGPATAAYPPLTGFAIYNGATIVSECSAQGVCADITGVQNGDKVSYLARSINSVGESKTAATRLAWAYLPPVVDNVTREPIYKSTTTATDGWVRVTIDSTDPTADAFSVTGASGSVVRTGATTIVDVKRPVGTQSVTVTPISQFDIPSGAGPTAGNTVGTVAVAGNPIIGAGLTVATVNDDELLVSGLSIDNNFSALALDVVYIAYQASGASANCDADSSGALVLSGPGVQSASTTISGLDANTVYNVVVCVSNGFGVGVSEIVSGVPWNVPVAPVGYTYEVSDGSGNGNFIITPSGVAPADFEARYSNYASGAATLYGQAPGITVRHCLIGFDDNYCGPESSVDPIDLDRVYQFDIGTVSNPVCTVGEILTPGVSGLFGPSAPSVSVTEFDYDDGPGPEVTVVGVGQVVPAGALQITRYTVSLTFTASTTGATYTYTETVNVGGSDPVVCS